jgi:hypothetical protein
MVGNIQADPVSPTNPDPLFSASIDLAFKTAYDAAWGGGLPINASGGSPFSINLGAVTKVRVFAIRPLDGQSLVVKLSSGAGANQAVPVSDLFVVRANSAGDEITAIDVVGVGRIEYLVAGNKT